MGHDGPAGERDGAPPTRPHHSRPGPRIGALPGSGRPARAFRALAPGRQGRLRRGRGADDARPTHPGGVLRRSGRVGRLSPQRRLPVRLELAARPAPPDRRPLREQSEPARRRPPGAAAPARPDHVGAVPSTSPARTLVDLAGVLGEGHLAQVLDEAIVRKLVRPSQLDDSLRRRPPGSGRPGAAALLRALEPWEAGLRADSPAEVKLFRRLRHWKLPTPVGQYEVYDGPGSFVARLDLAWPRFLVGLEYQGELFHTPRHDAHDSVASAGSRRSVGTSVRRTRATSGPVPPACGTS